MTLTVDRFIRQGHIRWDNSRVVGFRGDTAIFSMGVHQVDLGAEQHYSDPVLRHRPYIGYRHEVETPAMAPIIKVWTDGSDTYEVTFSPIAVLVSEQIQLSGSHGHSDNTRGTSNSQIRVVAETALLRMPNDHLYMFVQVIPSGVFGVGSNELGDLSVLIKRGSDRRILYARKLTGFQLAAREMEFPFVGRITTPAVNDASFDMILTAEYSEVQQGDEFVLELIHDRRFSSSTIGSNSVYSLKYLLVLGTESRRTRK